jgi:hypothetical protein
MSWHRSTICLKITEGGKSRLLEISSPVLQAERDDVRTLIKNITLDLMIWYRKAA